MTGAGSGRRDQRWVSVGRAKAEGRRASIDQTAGRPGKTMSVVLIDSWALVAKRQQAAQNNLAQIHLRGIVYRHAEYPDGSEITTSRIVHRHGEQLVTENGTHYELGKVNPEYNARFPNAKASLLRCVPEKQNEGTIIINKNPPVST